MATSPDHPELQFVEALQTDGKPMYTRGRPDGPPLWIVVHDMEAHELSTTAEATANYFHTGAGGREVSSHYCVDNDSVVQCVLLSDVAWTVGNRAGNYRGINWELAGFARQTRAEWLDPFGVAMFARMAPIVQSDAARFGIPLQRRTIAELKAFKPGVTSHNDLRLAFGVTDHTDPGPNFPWDYFLAVMNGDDMALRDDPDFRALIERVENMHNLNTSGSPDAGSAFVSEFQEMQAKLDAILAGLGNITVVVTEAQIATAVRKELDNTKLTGA